MLLEMEGDRNGMREGSEAGHYYGIQGPTFLVEFDNTQNHANHIHQIWRDFEGDSAATSSRTLPQVASVIRAGAD